MIGEANSERMRSLAQLSRDEIGLSEENVKQKIVVPMLEALGHERRDLDFEFSSKGKRIDIFIKGLPHDCKVVLDTKNYDEDLESHIDQIGTYAFQEGALVAVIVNGEELRMYSPMRGYAFRDSLLYSIPRRTFGEEVSQVILQQFLGRDNLRSRATRDFVHSREQEIVDLKQRVERALGRYDQQREELRQTIKQLETNRAKLDKEIENATNTLNAIDGLQEAEIANLYRDSLLPYDAVQSQHLTPPLELEEPFSPEAAHLDSDAVIENGRAVQITLPHGREKGESSWRKYNLIPVSRRIRSFFPGYRVSFVLEMDAGTLVTYIVGQKEISMGDPTGGTYFSAQLYRWYEAHKHLKPGDKLLVRKIADRKYQLVIA
jgi:predicted type IV restriction endonuclease